MAVPATGVVLVKNGERHLEACLKSLDFCARVIVVDSGSTDASIDIAKRCGAVVLHNEWQGPASQFRFAFANVDTDWVVTIDQDEILSDDLRASMVAALENPGDRTGFFCSRSSFYYDRFIKHCGWYPDWLLRVFRLDALELTVSGPHEHFDTKGATSRLSGDIIHYPYANLGEHLGKINYYTQVAADELRGKGRRGGLASALGHGFARFFKIYVLRAGFRDGRAGLILALHGFLYAFHKYIRIDERSGPES